MKFVGSMTSDQLAVPEAAIVCEPAWSNDVPFQFGLAAPVSVSSTTTSTFATPEPELSVAVPQIPLAGDPRRVGDAVGRRDGEAGVVARLPAEVVRRRPVLRVGERRAGAVRVGAEDGRECDVRDPRVRIARVDAHLELAGAAGLVPEHL